jgi:hypothetical protein
MKFKPTYLYIKQHAITGKLYFGKTIKNPETYIGSGSYWKRHIKKHGKEHVVNLWYCLFYNQEECMQFALQFSNTNNIVESKDWLNLKSENGLDGNPPGLKFTDKHKENISKSLKGKKGDTTPKSIETKLKMSIAKKGITKSDEHRKAMSLAKIGKKSNLTPRSKNWKLQEPNGNIIDVNNMLKFCKELDIHYGALMGAFYKKRPPSNLTLGYRLIS